LTGIIFNKTQHTAYSIQHTAYSVQHTAYTSTFLATVVFLTYLKVWLKDETGLFLFMGVSQVQFNEEIFYQ
jgi:hypothetical protein